jgi:hypothetical protein
MPTEKNIGWSKIMKTNVDSIDNALVLDEPAELLEAAYDFIRNTVEVPISQIARSLLSMN